MTASRVRRAPLRLRLATLPPFPDRTDRAAAGRAVFMPIEYAIRPAVPGAHLFHVTITVASPDPEGQRFVLPAWIPGSYMVREFARHIGRVTAMSGERKVALRKLDKHTWQAAPVTGALTLAYEVYAWDLSVRGAHLDATHGFFNGACVFMAVAGGEGDACTVDILPPPGRDFASWKLATGLTPARGTPRGSFGTYEAADYHELIDCPVELGRFAALRFDALGVAHEVAITGNVPKLDGARLSSDLKRVCEAQVRLFEPRGKRAPFAHYTFLAFAVGSGHGGLEHRNSTALVCRRDELPFKGMRDTTEGYRNFLGLASHEYFHSWLVKRIRPAAFVPYDLTRENYTRLLWIFEGFTSYYDDLMLLRAGLLTEAQYLELLAKTLTTVLQRTGRLKQSVAESSFDAWIKYYRPDENSPNAVVSYYQKGSLVALALDLVIRAESGGRRSLDDVLRLMWRRCRRAGPSYAGLAENEFAALAEEATGVALARRLHEWTEGTRDPDFGRLFEPFGIAFESRPALDSPQFAMLGVKSEAQAGDCRLAHVFDGTAAQQAGLSGGDVVVAVGGLRATAGNLDTLLARYAPGDRVEVFAFRRDELMRFEVELVRHAPSKFQLKVNEKSPAAATRLRRSWLARAAV